MSVDRAIEQLVDRLVDERIERRLCELVEQLSERPSASLADDVWLTSGEASVYTKRCTATIRQHAAAGTLRSTQAGRGRGRRYRREWLDAWLEQAHPGRGRAR